MSKQANKSATKKEQEQPEKKARLGLLLKAAEMMAGKGNEVTFDQQSMEQFYLKNLLGVSEKNVYSMGRELRGKFCKKCCRLYRKQEAWVDSDGLRFQRGLCPKCGKVKKYIMGRTPKA